MKKIALWSCLAIVFVLVVFNGIMAFGGSEETVFAATAIIVSVAIVIAMVVNIVIFTTTTFTITTPTFPALTAIVFVSVTTPTVAAIKPGSTPIAVALSILVLIPATISFANFVADQLKLSARRVVLISMVEGIAIFGLLYFFRSIGWWSAGIGVVGIAFILAFWQGCEWYDRRRPASLADTVHNSDMTLAHPRE